MFQQEINQNQKPQQNQINQQTEDAQKMIEEIKDNNQHEVINQVCQQSDFEVSIRKVITDNLNKYINCNHGVNQQIQICKDCKQLFFKLLCQQIFNKQLYQNDLISLQNNNKITYCGRILENDICFKCFDCELDSTGCLCSQCFDKTKHQGHRFFIQKDVNGCCDCGDKEMWKQEGFCSNHNGEYTDEEMDYNQIDFSLRTRMKEAFLVLYFECFNSIEKNLQNMSSYQIQNYDLCQKLIELVIDFNEQFIGKSIILQNYFDYVLNQNHFKSNFYQFFHVCEDIFNRPAKENLTNISHNCSCTIVETLIRYVSCMNYNTQLKLKNFFINMFSLFKFKQNLAKQYIKMFHFTFRYDAANLIQAVTFQELSTQLFTSVQLNNDIIHYKKDKQILEYEKKHKNTQDNSEFYILNIFEKLLQIIQQDVFYDELLEFTFHSFGYLIIRKAALDTIINNKEIQIRFLQLFEGLHYKVQFDSTKEYFQTDQASMEQVLLCEIVSTQIFHKYIEFLIQEEDIQKKHNIYLQLIRNSIYSIQRTTQINGQYNTNFQSIHIPLHRILIILVYGYFDFNWDNITSQNIELLAQNLGKELNFKDFLIEQVQYPLRTISFVKVTYYIQNLEIESKVNQLKYQEVQKLPIYYKYANNQFALADCLFIQFVFRLQYISFDTILNYYMINQKNNNDDNQLDIQEETNFKHICYQNLLELICYLMIDKFNLFNLFIKISFNVSDVKHNNKVYSYSNDFLATCLHQNNIQKYMYSKVNICKQCNQIATFSKSSQKFKIKEPYSSFYEPYYFYWENKLKYISYDSVRSFYQKNNQLHIMILGNNQIEKSFYENILNFSLFNFIHSQVISNEMSEVINYITYPILKLIYVRQLNNQNQEQVQIDTVISEILHILNQNIDSFSEELKATILFLLQNKIEKIQQKSQNNQSDKQKQILQAFQQRQTQFANKNLDNLKIEIESVEDVNCIICKNSVENKIYGVCGYLYKSNLYEMCKIISNNNVLGIQNQNKYSWFFNSCNHKIHNSCFNEYSYDQKFQDDIEFQCPICKKISNIFITYQENQNSNVDCKESQLLYSTFLNQFIIINSFYYSSEDINFWLEQENICDDLENIFINIINLTEISTFFSFMQKQSLYRQLLGKLKWFTLDNQDQNVSQKENLLFQKKRHIQIISELFDKITTQQNLDFSKVIRNNNILANDTTELYVLFLFYNFCYFSSGKDSDFQLIQSTISKFVHCKFYQIQIALDQLDRNISYFTNSEYCKLAVGSLYKIWTLFSLFYDLNEQQLQVINQTYDDFTVQFNSLLNLFKKKDNIDNQHMQLMTQQTVSNKQTIIQQSLNLVQLQFVRIQNKFVDFYSDYINRKCNLCSKSAFESELALCLICGTIICQVQCGQQKQQIGNLNSHSINMHFGTSLFVHLNSTELIIIQSPRNFKGQYLYTDQFGANFSIQSKDWNVYFLNEDLLKKMRMYLINQNVIDLIQSYEIKHDYHFKRSIF